MSLKFSNGLISVYQVILGFVYPTAAILAGLGTYLLYYSDLPNRITVHFDITRVPTTSWSKPVFGMVMATILVLSAVACTSIAISKRPFRVGDYQTIVAYGGFISAVVASLMVGAVIIHHGLSNWQDAIGPGWWLFAVILAGFVGRTGALYLAQKIHESDSGNR
jgi:hypothetical protein